MKIDYNEAIEIISDHIAYDMQRKAIKSEIGWLLNEVYKNKLDNLIEDWNLEDSEHLEHLGIDISK